MVRQFSRMASVLALTAAWSAAPAHAVDFRGTIDVRGSERTFTVFIPRDVYRARRPAPTVVVLHGALGTGADIRRHFGLDVGAAQDGFVAVYPDASRRAWNDGRLAGRRHWRHDRPVDDVQFLRRLADRLVEDGVADPDRLYLVGISNGGMMAYRMACEAPETFAAYAAIIANMPLELAERCKPGRAVPVLVINATDDPIMPYDGGGLGFAGRHGEVISTEETIDFWRRNNGCTAAPRRRDLPDAEPDDGSWVVAEQFGDCRGGAPVALLRVEGGGHTIPGQSLGHRPLLARLLGGVNLDIAAAEAVWKFFDLFHHRR